MNNLAPIFNHSEIQTKAFPTIPGKIIIHEFLKHVEETGEPDTWRFHSPNQPTPNSKFEELCDFSVPQKHRRTVGMASCPICSPLAPKYFNGFLAWFPTEGVVRAIGRDCAKNHFGFDVVNAARARRLAIEKRESAQDYLIRTYPKVKSITDKVIGLQPKARVVDLMQRKLWQLTSKSAVKEFTKYAKSGYLSVYQTEAIQTQDRFGRPIQSHIEKEIERYPVAGIDFLARKISVAAHATNTVNALNLIEQKTDQEALDFVADKLSSDEYLYQAEKLVRNAEIAAITFETYLSDAETFFANANLVNLSNWSQHSLVNSPIIFHVDPKISETLKLRVLGKTWTSMPLGQLFARRK